MLLAQSEAAANLVSALIGAVAALIVASIGWYASSRRDRGQRDYERRQSTLTDVQDAALALRQALQDYGRLLRRYPNEHPPELLDAQTVFDHARGELEVRMSRIDDPELRRLIKAWRDTAQVTSISDQDDATAQDEQELWSRLNIAIGKRLTGER